MIDASYRPIQSPSAYTVEIDGDIALVVPEKLAYRFHIFREAGGADDKLRVKWVQKPKIPFSN